MQWTHEHLEVRKTLKRYIDEQINPHVDEWEEAEIFPAHKVFKGLGDLGLLGLTKPEAYGGAGLDYSYNRRCCTNQFEAEQPRTPDAAMPRRPSAGGLVQ